jgi:phage gp45-like
MAGLDLAGLIKVGVDILKTTVSKLTKRIVAQLGSVEEETTDADNVEWWQHVGFASRPPKPDPKKKAAQAVTIAGGDRDVVIASQDQRGLELYGNLADGETCVYAAGEDGNAQARILLKKDGGLHIFTKEGNTTDGKGIVFSVRSDGSVDLVTSKGVALMMGTDASAKLFTPNGSFEINASGAVKIAASGKLSLSGASVAIGGDPTAGAVLTTVDLAKLIPIIATGISGAGPTGGAAAAAFTTAATALVAALMATKRTTAS